MKRLLTFFCITGIFINAFSQTRKCIDCNKATSFYNGSSGPTSQSSANIAIDTSTKVVVLKDGFLLKGKVICKYEGGNNSAWNVRITVLLPEETQIVSYTTTNACLSWNDAGHPEGGTKSGYIVYDLKILDRQNTDGSGDSFSFEIKTKKSVKSAGMENFAIFVQSQIPDITLCDNYWYWKDTSYCEKAFIQRK